MPSKQGETDKDAASWYNNDLKEVPEEMLKLLETYSHIPRDKAIPHILAVREDAFKLRDYPCIGQFRFLVLVLHELPTYGAILERLRGGKATFMDVGIALGQDLRRLVADGVPSEQTYGLDIDAELMDLGYRMFNDRDTLRTTFVAGDIFDESRLPGWDEHLRGRMDVINASAFFTLFDNWAAQRRAACVLARLSRSGRGAVVVGRQAGAVSPRLGRGIWEGSTTFFHNAESFAAFWDEVGQETGTRWVTTAWVDAVAVQGLGRGADQADQPYHFSEKRRLMFSVERQE